MKIDTEKTKANLRPISGQFEKVATEVRRLLGWFDDDVPFLTSRMAARKTGVNYTTINQMLNGDRPKADTIQKFAEGMGEDPSKLLQLAGYLPQNQIQIDGHYQPKESLILDNDDYHPIEGLSTGLRTLDLVTGGLLAGMLTIVAGRPGIGKTSLLLGIAEHVASTGAPVALFTPGHNADEIEKRISRARSHINYHSISNNNLPSGRWNQLTNTLQDVYDLPIHIDDNFEIDPCHIIRQSDEPYKPSEIKLVMVIDLELVEAEKHRSTRNEELLDIVRQLKMSARALNCHVILSCGITTDAVKRDDRRPRIGDLPGAAGIADIADSVFFLYTNPYAHGSVKEYELIIEKNANGQLGMMKLRFIPEYRKFVNFEPDDEEPKGF